MGFFATLFSARIGNKYLRRLRLNADKTAVQKLGQEQFVRTLMKMDAMGLHDVEEKRKEKPTIWKCNRFYFSQALAKGCKTSAPGPEVPEYHPVVALGRTWKPRIGSPVGVWGEKFKRPR